MKNATAKIETLLKSIKDKMECGVDILFALFSSMVLQLSNSKLDAWPSEEEMSAEKINQEQQNKKN